MRELHGYHGEHRRHARDAHAPADNPAARARDRPGHAARDAAMPRVLADPEERKAAHLAYRQKVEAAEAEYAARHARPKDDARAPEQVGQREPKPEHALPETRERPTDAIARRSLPEQAEAAGQAKHQRPWLPNADAVKGVSDIGMLVTAVTVALGDASARWDAVAAAAVSVVVSNIAWANRRRKESDGGDRPEG